MADPAAAPMPPLPPPLPPVDPASNDAPLDFNTAVPPPPLPPDIGGESNPKDGEDPVVVGQRIYERKEDRGRDKNGGRGDRRRERSRDRGRDRRDRQPRPPREQGSRSSPVIGPIDPANNNAPLEFNTNKDKPPMPIEKNGNGEAGTSETVDQNQDPNQGETKRTSKERDRERRDRDRPPRVPRPNPNRERSHDRDRSRDRFRNNRDRDRPNNMGYGATTAQSQPGYSQWGGSAMGSNMWSQGNMAGGGMGPMGQMSGQMGQMSSQMGQGQMGQSQMTSTMGQGQMASTMGQGQMTSTMGQGQMTSPMAQGQMTSPMAQGQMTSQMGQMGNMGQMGHMGQMAGQMTPMSGQMGSMGGQMGPMGGQMTAMGGQMGQMGQMGMGTMGPMDGPLSGEFRITWGMFGWMMSPEGLTVTIKNQINCKACVLTPPAAKAPPATRERPLGCRTVFVGGLPENINEDIVRDVFERCGEITTVRLSKKNFCHIRYELEEYVDNAIFLSGYKMRINDSSEKADTGRLHCDYAQAREDQYEYEMRQRAIEREQRHYERMEAERLRREAEALRPPSPPPIPHYSDHEASLVTEQLKVISDDDTFDKAAMKLNTWLERGDCSKRNSQQFYNMIQSTNTQVRRILEEKAACEDELTRFKEQMRLRIQSSIKAFGHIERVFTSASHQKVKDHFTKAQRRNIDMWKKQAEEIKNIQLDDGDKADEDEMDVSDDENAAKKAGPLNALKDENYSLRTQLEAAENDLEMTKAEHRQEVATKDDEIDTYKKTLSGMQQQLLTNAHKKREDEARVAELIAKNKKLKELNKKIKNEKPKDGEAKEDKEDKDFVKEVEEVEEVDSDIEELKVSFTAAPVNDQTAQLVSMISTFLHVHTKGASVDYIWSFIQQYDKEITPSEIQNMLTQYPTVYKQITTGVGASLERKWVFIGFKDSLF